MCSSLTGNPAIIPRCLCCNFRSFEIMFAFLDGISQYSESITSKHEGITMTRLSINLSRLPSRDRRAFEAKPRGKRAREENILEIIDTSAS